MRRLLVWLGFAALGGAVIVATQIPHRIGPDAIYPPSYATGVINQSIQSPEQVAATICNPQWSTKSERPPASYTTNLKIKQLKQLGYSDQTTADYEEDHLISLELGGNPTDPNNLWPQSYNTQPLNARHKDKLENTLHALICSGKLTLAQAQQAITFDWVAAYQTYVSPKLGASANDTDPDDQ